MVGGKGADPSAVGWNGKAGNLACLKGEGASSLHPPPGCGVVRNSLPQGQLADPFFSESALPIRRGGLLGIERNAEVREAAEANLKCRCQEVW